MATIGTIIVNAIANVAPFEKGMKGMQSALGSLGGGGGGGMLGAVMGGFTGLAIGLASQVSAIDLATDAWHGMMDATKRVDELAATADALGTSTQRLTGLSAAAELANVSNSALATAMDKVARAGTGETFEQVAERIASIENPSARAAAAFDVFGKQAKELMPLLAGGAKGIEAAKEEAIRLGQVLSTVEVANITALDNSMVKLNRTWQAAWEHLTAALAPAMTQVINLLTDMLGAWNSLFGVTGEALKADMAAAEAKARATAEAFALAEAEDARAKEAAKLLEDLTRKAEGLTRSLRTPAEVFSDTIREAHDLMGRGLLTAATWERAIAKAGEEYDRATKKAEAFSRAGRADVGAVTKDSTAGFSAVQAALRASREREIRAEEATAAATKATAEKMDLLIAATRDSKVVVREATLVP